jgi:beta-lactamase superfamily II metal-dependent hydrolase
MLRVTLGSRAFLITGDTERAAEADIVAGNPNIRADVLKVSHHGSATSTTENFLRLVMPSYAVIQVGADNNYGHPARAVIERLQDIGAEVFRTDFHGEVVFKTDGTSLEVMVEH